jgi:hypothetical protein
MASEDYLTRCFVKDPSVVSRKIAEEFILVPVKQKAGDIDGIYTVDEVAGRIWELIDGKRSLQEIGNIITEEFDVASKEAEADLVEFLRQLEQIGAVRAA